VSKMAITNAQRLTVLSFIQKLAYSTSVEQYDNLYKQFQESSPASVVTYFDNNWNNIRDEWVLGLKFSTGSFMNTTNNRLERLNGQLKAVVKCNSSVEEFLDKFYVVMAALRNEHDHKIALQFQKKTVTPYLEGSVEHKYSQLLTSYAVKFVYKQLSYTVNVPVETATPSEYTISTSEGIMTVTATSCHCMFRRAMGLPCRHIFAVRRLIGADLYESDLCNPRWMLTTCKETQRLFQPRETLQGSCTLAISEPSTTRATLTYHQKFRMATKQIRELASIMSDVSTRSFLQRLQQLKQLQEGWQLGNTMIVSVVPMSENSHTTAAIIHDVSVDVEELDAANESHDFTHEIATVLEPSHSQHRHGPLIVEPAADESHETTVVH